MHSSATRRTMKTGRASAVTQRATWLLNRPTVRLRKVTMRGPCTYWRLASSWANIQTSIPSTCPMIAPATPRQPKRIPRTVGGTQVKSETTRSSPGARHSHALIRVPAAPSRGIRWRRPAKPAMPTRVDAAMSSSGFVIIRTPIGTAKVQLGGPSNRANLLMQVRIRVAAPLLFPLLVLASSRALNHMDQPLALLLIVPGYVVQAWLFEAHRALGGTGYVVTMVGVSALVWTLILLGLWAVTAKVFRRLSLPRRSFIGFKTLRQWAAYLRTHRR